MIIAEEIKQLRAILGITQKELAEKIGTSIKTIANYEAGAVIPMGKQRLLHSLLVNARNNTSSGDNINSNRNVHNEGSINGSVSTGDNHTSINGGVSVGNDSTSKLSDYEQRILLLEEKIQHLEEMLKEKERFIQVLLANK